MEEQNKKNNHAEVFLERKDYNNVITIKLVFPVLCNYNCVFCYNRHKQVPMMDKQQFLENFIPSLDALIHKIGDQNPISLDITGGEPTLDVALFRDVMQRLKYYSISSKVSRVTLTTNGTHLRELALSMAGVVNYVNISVHSPALYARKYIFGSANVLTDGEYCAAISDLRQFGITVSASAVIYRKIPYFNEWRDMFIDWARALGFISLRFRCDVFWKQNYVFDAYLLDAVHDPQFQVLVHERTPDSHWCRLRLDDKFRVFFLHGVLDTSQYTKGIEYVIDTDGHCYCDYYRRTPIEEYKYHVGRIFDKVKL